MSEGRLVRLLVFPPASAKESVAQVCAAAFAGGDLQVEEVLAVPAGKAAWARALEDFEGSATPCLFTLGGAGASANQGVPDAVAELLVRRLAGIPELIRALGDPPEALFFRGTAGVTRGGKLIVNLPPFSPWFERCLAQLARTLPHALDKIAGDPGECGGPS